MTWWAFGFVVHQAIAGAWSLRRGFPAPAAVLRGVGRSAALWLSAMALVVGSLSVARWYQARQASDLFASYLAAPWIPLDSPSGALPNIDRRAWPQYLAVDLDETKCGPSPAVTFRYDPNQPNGDLSRKVTVGRRSKVAGPTRILQQVFEHYQGLEFSDARPGCAVGAYRLADLHQFPLLLGVTLPPDWHSLPLYQRIEEWEADRLLPPFVTLPGLSSWSPAGRPGTASIFGTLAFVGDRSTFGYQLTSPRVEAPAGARVFVRTDLRAQRGLVCLGALNGTAAKWLEPASAVRQEMRFTVDETGGFIVAVANCNPTEIAAPSRFSISTASYAIE